MGLAIRLGGIQDLCRSGKHLEYLRQRQPDNLRVQVSLAQCRYAFGDRADAVRLVDGVLAEHADYAPALALRGQLALEGEQSAAAETWLRRAVTGDPRNHQARYNLMTCLYRNGKDGEAHAQEQELKQREADQSRFHEL